MDAKKPQHRFPTSDPHHARAVWDAITNPQMTKKYFFRGGR